MNKSASSSFVATALRGVLVGIVSLGLSACGGSSDPVNFNGTYTTTIVNGENGCGLDRWTAGEKSDNVQVIATTDALNRNSVLVAVQGIAGGLLELSVGSRTFVSTSSGNELTGLLVGREANDKGCMQSTRIRLKAKLNGDTLEGSLSYSFEVKNPEACGIKANCANIQTIKGLRPPVPSN
jgi:hypothetical protein